MNITANSPGENLHQAIKRLTLRWRLANTFNGLGWGLAAGLLALCVTAVTSRITPFWSSAEVQRFAIWFVVGGTLCGTITGGLRHIPLPQRLRIFDRQLALADSMTTAWEIAQDYISAPAQLESLQLAQTLRNVEGAAVTQTFPARPARASTMATIFLCLILVPLLFLPNPQDAFLISQKLEAQFVSQAVEHLNSTLDSLARDTELTPEDRQTAISILEQAKAILEDLQTNLDDKQSALIEAEYQLEMMRNSGDRDIDQQIAGVADLTSDSVLPEDSVINQLLEALSQGDLEAASTYLNEIAQRNSAEISTQDEINALVDAMAQLAAAFQEKQPGAAAAFSSAAEASADSSTTRHREALQQAADALQTLSRAQNQDTALQQAQAGVQQAQRPLRQASGQSPGSGAGQLGNRSSESFASDGQPGGNDSGSTVGDTGTGADGDGQNGISGTILEQEMERLAAVGGEITLPRSAAEGNPVLVPGMPNESRVPYHEVYMQYAGAAEAILSRRTYPPLLRDYIHDYFSSLGN